MPSTAVPPLRRWAPRRKWWWWRFRRRWLVQGAWRPLVEWQAPTERWGFEFGRCLVWRRCIRRRWQLGLWWWWWWRLEGANALLQARARALATVGLHVRTLGQTEALARLMGSPLSVPGCPCWAKLKDWHEFMGSPLSVPGCPCWVLLSFSRPQTVKDSSMYERGRKRPKRECWARVPPM